MGAFWLARGPSVYSSSIISLPGAVITGQQPDPEVENHLFVRVRRAPSVPAQGTFDPPYSRVPTDPRRVLWVEAVCFKSLDDRQLNHLMRNEPDRALGVNRFGATCRWQMEGSPAIQPLARRFL